MLLIKRVRCPKINLIFYEDKKKESRPMYEITKIGLELYIGSLKKINVDLTEWKIKYDLNLLYLKEGKEIHYLNIIKHSFNNIKTINQYKVLNYRLDLYFPELNLAIECDELGHLDRDNVYEKKREVEIIKTLNCTFIRFNPDEQDFNIGKVINKINNIYIKYILNKNKTVI